MRARDLADTLEDCSDCDLHDVARELAATSRGREVLSVLLQRAEAGDVLEWDDM